MLSDTAILKYSVKSILRMFAIPRNRRELAQTLRRVRLANGHKAARLVLAHLSAQAIQAIPCNADASGD